MLHVLETRILADRSLDCQKLHLGFGRCQERYFRGSGQAQSVKCKYYEILLAQKIDVVAHTEDAALLKYSQKAEQSVHRNVGDTLLLLTPHLLRLERGDNLSHCTTKTIFLLCFPLVLFCRGFYFSTAFPSLLGMCLAFQEMWPL